MFQPFKIQSTSTKCINSLLLIKHWHGPVMTVFCLYGLPWKHEHLCLRRGNYCSLRVSLPNTHPKVVIFHLKSWGKFSEIKNLWRSEENIKVKVNTDTVQICINKSCAIHRNRLLRENMASTLKESKGGAYA